MFSLDPKNLFDYKNKSDHKYHSMIQYTVWLELRMGLDRFDKQILEILTHEDLNLNELSERINLSVSSVHRT